MRLTLLLFAYLTLSALGFGATLHVPNVYPTIQEAIDAATKGDTVLVQPGTYMENIDFKGKAITVMSADGPSDTIIDGGQTGKVALFNSGEESDSILEGFTITNGQTKHNGGGVYCYNASPTITNNIIKGNTAKNGGGVYCFYKCAPTIMNNTITGNTATGDALSSGGGIYCYDASSIITDNQITDNTANFAASSGGGITCSTYSDAYISGNTIMDNSGSHNGGGITCTICSPIISNNRISENYSQVFGAGVCCTENACPTIEGNIIQGNSTSPFGNGGGIYSATGSSPLIRNNFVLENSAGDNGGALDITEGASPLIVNNTFYKNSAGKGGGITCRISSTAVVVNTILWNNNADKGPEIFISGSANPSTLTISNSDVKGGQSSAHVKSGCTLNWGSGMVDADPKFFDVSCCDLHVCCSSPCRDTGDNAAPGLSDHDFEGDPRIAYGTVDMGADEFYTHLYCTGDATPGGKVEVKFVGLPGTSPVGLCIGTGVLDPPIPSMWGDWYLKFPIFGPMGMPQIPSSGILIIPGTIPATPPPPYSLPMQALIGAELSNLSVLEIK